MSQQQSFNNDSLPIMPNIEFLQGNTGGAVGPDPVTHIIQVLGDTTQGVNVNGNIGTFTETITISDSTTSQKGVVLLATNAETIAGTVTTKATTPDDIKAKLGSQTLHGIPYGGGATAALNWLAEASNGQIPIGNTGNPPALGNITSTDGSVSVNNGPGTIDLSVPSLAPANYVNVTHAMSPYTVLTNDYFISCDVSLGVVTILLPNAPATKKEFVVKDRTGNASINNITVSTVGGAVNIDGSTSYIISDPYESSDFLFNGTTYETF